MRYLSYDFGNKQIEISVDNSEIEDCMYDALENLTREQIIDLFMDCVSYDEMFDIVFEDLYERNESVARDLLDERL